MTSPAVSRRHQHSDCSVHDACACSVSGACAAPGDVAARAPPRRRLCARHGRHSRLRVRGGAMAAYRGPGAGGFYHSSFAAAAPTPASVVAAAPP